MPSLTMDSQLQLQAAGAWGSMYLSAQEPVEPRHTLIPAAPAKKPANGIRRKNLETCTEALGCETGAVDTASPAWHGFDFDGHSVEAECGEGNRSTRENEEEHVGDAAGRVRRPERRGPLPPPLTTLARGASSVRMVHERRGGRLEVYAVRTPGGLEAERGGGRLRLRVRLLPLLCFGAGNASGACCCLQLQERQGPEAKAKEEASNGEEEQQEVYGFSMYERGGWRCVEPEDGAAAARRGKPWELELPQYPCIF